jgi:mRNA interferase ChpB
MERGDIYLVSLDPTVGHEQQGKRPVLVISPGKFNRLTRMPIVLPITSGGNFARTAGFAVSLMGAGIRTTGVVRCDQPRALDLRARGAKRLETIPDHIIDEVWAKSVPCSNSDPPQRSNPGVVDKTLSRPAAGARPRRGSSCAAL